MTPLDLTALASELGMTTAEANAAIGEAVCAGLLRLVETDNQTVTLQGVIPEED